MKLATENKKTAIIKSLLCLVVAAALYLVVFTNMDRVNTVMQSKTYFAPLMAIGIVLLAAFSYGTAAAKFLKHTLEEKLKTQHLREE